MFQKSGDAVVGTGGAGGNFNILSVFDGGFSNDITVSGTQSIALSNRVNQAGIGISGATGGATGSNNDFFNN